MPHKKYRRHRVPMIRLSIGLSEGLLKLVDETAAKEFTTRSETIRTALLWYLRPGGKELHQSDPEVILDILQRRKLKASLTRTLKDL